jgi:hypothetical protein
LAAAARVHPLAGVRELINVPVGLVGLLLNHRAPVNRPMGTVASG